MQSTSCVHAPVGEAVFDAHETSPGRFWLSSHQGLWQFDGARVKRLAGNSGFPGGNVQHISASPRGGYWIAGSDALLRLRPCGTCANGWALLEHPGAWQGLPGSSAISAMELPNGDLWIAGNRGAWRVPAHVRGAPHVVPPLRLTSVTVDGRGLASDASFDLRPHEHQLGLEYAALSYRDRSLLRFRSRLDDSGWSVPTSQSNLQFIDLPDGHHRVEMQGSLDGRSWSESVPVEFEVVPPWYRRAWAWALYALLAAALASALYRWRVAMLLGVERERSHIAMDLHDEMGASLGSIGMLAEVAARSEVGADERRRLATEIAAIAGFLGGGLRSLVWSMRSERAGIAELAAQVVDHARRLFPAEPPRLRIDLPERYPPMPVRADIRRHVLLIALEAMHNAARHAAAREVRVALLADGEVWMLRVEDDGRGFDTTGGSHGTGMESMHRRAAAIGARIELHTKPGGGTAMSLRFDPFRTPPAPHDHVLAQRRRGAESATR
jgi:signal transduction histidine kinase